MSSTHSGDSGPTTPSPILVETRVDQPVSGPESSNEAGLALPDENNNPDQVERFQVETDDNSLAEPVIVIPPGISLFDELPPLPDSPVESIGTTENRLPTLTFDQHHDDSSNPLPSKSPAVAPASDELPAPLAEDSGSDWVTSSDEDDDERNTKSKPERFKRAKKSRVTNSKKDSDDAESSEDDESIHNPFDFEGTPSSSNDDPITSSPDSSSVFQDTSAKNLWERMKNQGEMSDALDRLMALEGLEDVKIQFLKIKATIDAARERKGCLRRRDLNMAFLGNPGTGKPSSRARLSPSISVISCTCANLMAASCDI